MSTYYLYSFESIIAQGEKKKKKNTFYFQFSWILKVHLLFIVSKISAWHWKLGQNGRLIKCLKVKRKL